MLQRNPYLLNVSDLWDVELEHVLYPHLQCHHGAGATGAGALHW